MRATIHLVVFIFLLSGFGAVPAAALRVLIWRPRFVNAVTYW